uniref:Uncharacterized protein n=1 Tax=Anguilla anguilla TaxID=7936 RepID=A0A0E9SU29_ANGAN
MKYTVYVTANFVAYRLHHGAKPWFRLAG